jgi:hypothetical protein
MVVVQAVSAHRLTTAQARLVLDVGTPKEQWTLPAASVSNCERGGMARAFE